MNLKKALNIAMAMKELDQKDLAKLSGVNKTTISQTINGKTKPGTGTMEKLAKGLGITYSELVALGE